MTDRTVKFGFRNALDYQIIVNWVIAAHKSQGVFQLDVNRADREEFVILESGAADRAADEPGRTNALFQALGEQAAHPKRVARGSIGSEARSPARRSREALSGACKAGLTRIAFAGSEEEIFFEAVLAGVEVVVASLVQE